MSLSKFVDSFFPQCNVHTGVQGGCLAFTPEKFNCSIQYSSTLNVFYSANKAK